MALAYAVKHGLELDEELKFHDVGVSAFRGQNREAGRLADFLEAVRVGLVPQGSFLLVEQLDRLSRLTPRKALRVLEDIADAGVVVVTLNDERRYTSSSLDNEPMDLLTTIVMFMRANEESTTKARRLSEAWAAKRARAAERPLTSKAPLWLRIKADRSGFELIPERAAIVREMFERTLRGEGQHKIAEWLNAAGVRPWGRGAYWQRSYIAKVLTNPAVIGTMTPRTLVHKDGRKVRDAEPPVAGYFPAVITDEVFAEVQARRSSVGSSPRGRQAAVPLSNILAGIAQCPKCGRTMTRVQKGKRSRPSLVCAAAKAGAGCEYKSVPYELLSAAILGSLHARLADFEGASGEDDVDVAIIDADEYVVTLKMKANAIADELLGGHSQTLRDRLSHIEAQIAEAQQTRDALIASREVSSGPLVAARVDRARTALLAAPLDIGQANRALRALFSAATVNWPERRIDFHWLHGGVLELPYADFGPYRAK